MTVFEGSMEQNKVLRIRLINTQSIALFQKLQDHSVGKGKSCLTNSSKYLHGNIDLFPHSNKSTYFEVIVITARASIEKLLKESIASIFETLGFTKISQDKKGTNQAGNKLYISRKQLVSLDSLMSFLRRLT